MLESINLSSLPAFLLILVRVTSFFVTVPIFSYKNIPNHFKIGCSFFLAWIMYYTISIPEIVLDETFILLVFKEAIVGLFLGLIAYMILAALQVAGGFIDFQMGFAIANVIDPQTGAQSPLTGQYFYTIALLFLLVVNGHHLLIDGIFYSYQTVPLDAFIPFGNEAFSELITQTMSRMFLIAFQMAIPVVGCLFLVDVALGIIARTVPQLNVFVVGLPLKILVSFIVLLPFLGLYAGLVKNLFGITLQTMRSLLEIFGGA
ncbi:flagellar biosynthetic protein FliR [Virgibacillus senegalensis]|uniref:flagellar biosynthetic protein FliR n=1 Tax=Virgibacillus senegalensis TaxID=1499679 RepID=UPI00069CD122|nr:flagellar biosynthetic protein FliR [Virgibacillus senegalensis]